MLTDGQPKYQAMLIDHQPDGLAKVLADRQYGYTQYRVADHKM
jgi:hypothetical protein